jgi:multimeric flavodoxin WrbA
MKIAGIACSPHRDGMTAKLIHKALDGARAAGAETSLIILADEDMKPCLGCDGNCWETRECALDPGTAALHSRLQDADGIVMAVPVYCWQMNSLAHLFIDRMRWDTGSVLQPRNPRAAFGIACAGGSGTGCVLALQALYRYFYNWAFHGVSPLPVTRFNFNRALNDAYNGGVSLVHKINGGLQPFDGLGGAIALLEALPHMMDGPVDELRLIVAQLMDALPQSAESLIQTLYAESALAEAAMERGERAQASRHLSLAYEAGCEAFNRLGESPLQ